MKMYKEGEYIDLTPEEEQELLSNTVQPQITMENRVSAIETAIADLAIQQMCLEVDSNA